MYTFICEQAESYEESFENGEVNHHTEVTPQRRVSSAPKSMGKEMGMLPCDQDDKLHVNRITTIAGLLQNHVVAMETDKQQIDQNSISHPVKRTSEDDSSDLAIDGVSNRPVKRRRKLIVAGSPEKDKEGKEENENNNVDIEKEQIATPVNNTELQVVEYVGITGRVKDKPFLTSTPNDVINSNDSSIEEDMVLPSTVHHYKRRRVLRRAPAGDHVTVTGSDGTRVYLRLKSESKKQDKQDRPKRYQLLSVPFYQLRHEVESKVCCCNLCVCKIMSV